MSESQTEVNGQAAGRLVLAVIAFDFSARFLWTILLIEFPGYPVAVYERRVE